jgi:hypothetical protein
VPAGRGAADGTRIINYLKQLALVIAEHRGLAAGIIAQSDCQPGPGGGAARQFWLRQRLRATPQAMLLTRALHEWDTANEVYANAVPVLCWLSPSSPAEAVDARESTRAQQHASAQQKEHFRHTRHTRRVTVKLRGALTLLPPIEPEMDLPPDRSSPAAAAGRSVPDSPARGGRPPPLLQPLAPPPPACAICRVHDPVGIEKNGPPSARARREARAAASSGPVLECRACSVCMHASCDPERPSLPDELVDTAVASQREAAAAAAALHMGLPAAADPSAEFTCGRCLALIAAGCADGAPDTGGEVAKRLPSPTAAGKKGARGGRKGGGRSGAAPPPHTCLIGEDTVFSGSVIGRVCEASTLYKAFRLKMEE